jgi:hypothetical protein
MIVTLRIPYIVGPINPLIIKGFLSKIQMLMPYLKEDPLRPSYKYSP